VLGGHLRRRAVRVVTGGHVTVSPERTSDAVSVHWLRVRCISALPPDRSNRTVLLWVLITLDNVLLEVVLFVSRPDR